MAQSAEFVIKYIPKIASGEKVIIYCTTTLKHFKCREKRSFDILKVRLTAYNDKKMLKSIDLIKNNNCIF